MAHGGKRPGSGRPKGVKAGTKAERLEKMLNKGTVTPLEYMLNILNTKKTSPEKKMWAAERAAPYVHSRLSSVNSTISGDDDKPVAVTIGWRKRNVIKGLLGTMMPVMKPNQGLLEGPVQFNNPGNIETGQGYAGETGETYADRFSVFDSPQMGVRAVARDITTKIDRHKGDLTKIISEYAPPSENDTNAYIDYVKKFVGKDKVTKADLPSIVKSVIEMENGIDSDLTKLYLSDDVFKEAIDLSKISLPSEFTLEDARKKLNE